MVTPLLVFLLPDRNKIDEIAYKKGQIVSEFRRGIAWCIDIFIVMLPVFIYVLYNNMDIAAFIYNSKYIVITGAYIAVMFTAAASISKGRTIGKALVNIRLVKVYDKKMSMRKNVIKEPEY